YVSRLARSTGRLAPLVIGKTRRSTVARGLCLFLSTWIVLSSCVAAQLNAAVAASRPATAPTTFAGWAMDAYPGDSMATLQAEMRKQISAGANVIWLGHNNPGEVDQTKGEPGLSYAVWQALGDAASPRHADAQAIVQAVHRALEAAKSLGVRVVLPVGYQIQMGKAWNAAHPNDLRIDGGGKVYWNGGNAASFYSPTYRHDIIAYYKWVDTNFIRPFSDTIQMVNIADEPSDGDYTTWANQAFRAQYGYGMDQLGKNPSRLTALGRFQAEYIANYAAWSATQWLQIDPTVKVTLSFDGGYGRYKHEGPDLEAIFRNAPSNFVVTFDAYPRDGLYSTPMRPGDLPALFALIRTLGHYSAVYHRPLWLWSTANSWGLNGASADPGNIADAVANGIYLAQLVNESGGTLEGIAVWNYNIKGQGLFNDTHSYYYDPNQMFARVSASFPLLRSIMAAPPLQPDAIILAPNAHDLLVGGQIRAMRALDSYDWTSLVALARDDVSAPVLSHLDGENLANVRTAIVLDRNASDLTTADRTALIRLLSDGGSVIAASSVARELSPAAAASHVVAAGGTPAMSIRRYALAHGTLLAVAGAPVEQIFTDANQAWASSMTKTVLHRPVQTGGYLLNAGGVTLLYSGQATPGASLMVSLPLSTAQGALTVYNTSGAATRTMPLNGRTGALRVYVARRSYALAAPAKP
ncbi:MAG: hypothetical protein JWO42_1335, partial [Chloroflexi bacterium]|nr:hypothetical protein [Chloroflexota bacterium]